MKSVSPASPGSGHRQKMVLASSTDRTIDYGFTDSDNQNHEYGKLWYSQGWLFISLGGESWLTIGSFPSTYLLEVDKQGLVEERAQGSFPAVLA